VIPTNRGVARIDHEDVIYKTQMEKFRAVVAEIEEKNKRGQPVLVGTTSVEKSEIVAKLLQRKGIPHEVLNAKNHSREAEIVAQAGRAGAVTISTNMAGRGTDIKLGGDVEKLARAEFDPATHPSEHAAAVERWEAECKVEREKVLVAGGLFIIGTERHESRRVDNQLRGRSGRQGDPGGSRFYLSLEDDLLRIFGSDKITVWMERMGLEDDEPIEHRWITSAVENAQRKVEGHNFNMRKNLLEYDDVMNYQRKGVYEIRRRALVGEAIPEMVNEAVTNIILDITDDFLVEGLRPEHWNIPGMRGNLKRVFELEWEESDNQLRDLSREELRTRMSSEAQQGLDKVIEAMTPEAFKSYARMLLLQYTDSLWKDHLLAIDRLRQGVSLRGYGQRNPLLEYKREALQMYQQMSAMRDEMVITRLFHTEAQVAQAAAEVEGKSTARRLAAGTFRPQATDELAAAAARAQQAAQRPAPPPPAPAPAPAAAPFRAPEKGEEARLFAYQYQVRRNDPCPCGSGLKYKKCCFVEDWLPPGVDLAVAAMAASEAVAVAAPEPEVEAPPAAPTGVQLPDFLLDAYAPPDLSDLQDDEDDEDDEDGDEDGDGDDEDEDDEGDGDDGDGDDGVEEEVAAPDGEARAGLGEGTLDDLDDEPTTDGGERPQPPAQEPGADPDGDPEDRAERATDQGDPPEPRP
jgi:preprotein translocase subunit SecA